MGARANKTPVIWNVGAWAFPVGELAFREVVSSALKGLDGRPQEARHPSIETTPAPLLPANGGLLLEGVLSPAHPNPADPSKSFGHQILGQVWQRCVASSVPLGEPGFMGILASWVASHESKNRWLRDRTPECRAMMVVMWVNANGGLQLDWVDEDTFSRQLHHRLTERGYDRADGRALLPLSEVVGQAVSETLEQWNAANPTHAALLSSQRLGWKWEHSKTATGSRPRL